MIDPNAFDVLTFDVYGTLIDWETGIVNALQPILRTHDIGLSDEPLLELFAGYEAELERGAYLTYRQVLAQALRQIGQRYNFVPTEAEEAQFSDSVGDWPVFTDSPEALSRLKQRYKLAPITNCDDDLFARSNQRLEVTFDWIITAQQVGSYKPALPNFHFAFRKIGLPPSRLLHVAQSLFHDHVPAKQLGLTTVWINRRHNKPGWGATPPAEAQPDLELPDLKALADLLCP